MAHLRAFSASIPGKGTDKNTDLAVEVVFSNHVYTERAKHGEEHHAIDHHGTKRALDLKRYDMSKALPALIAQHIIANSLTHVSKSYGGIDNLIFIETADNEVWAVVYCFQPLDDGRSVRMEILSCHAKLINQKGISRKTLSYFARKCIFEKTRTPKA
ncbi:hypothetical protein HRR99_01810 [Agrobacterium vaccinii]|uniref:hypothetical protein n=1 Tax=Agrobacterium vaccinii TaxID=2735528 RepID=UPI001E2EDACF|nr:hypothetical protein [Agrobacterium vaccinii]UHS60349.1 hypothetical protein HRR99_01810 [Agrobacterium vaccinii]